jgi:hypothetical protein
MVERREIWRSPRWCLSKWLSERFCRGCYEQKPVDSIGAPCRFELPTPGLGIQRKPYSEVISDQMTQEKKGVFDLGDRLTSPHG